MSVSVCVCVCVVVFPARFGASNEMARNARKWPSNRLEAALGSEIPTRKPNENDRFEKKKVPNSSKSFFKKYSATPSKTVAKELVPKLIVMLARVN